MTEERLSYERQKGLELLMARAGGIAPVTGHAVARLPAGQPDFQKFPSSLSMHKQTEARPHSFTRFYVPPPPLSPRHLRQPGHGHPRLPRGVVHGPAAGGLLPSAQSLQ